MTMCFAGPQSRMMACHSAIERPYFFSIEGKYDAGPAFGQRGDSPEFMVMRSSRSRRPATLDGKMKPGAPRGDGKAAGERRTSALDPDTGASRSRAGGFYAPWASMLTCQLIP